jgi:hypothetical protein
MTEPSDDSPTRPSAETRKEEARDERVTTHADAQPTSDEEAAAERAGEADEETSRSYKEAIERGAGQEGEGRLP